MSLGSLSSATNAPPQTAAEPMIVRDHVRREVLGRDASRVERKAMPKFLAPAMRPLARSADAVTVRMETRAVHLSLVAGREYLPGNQRETSGYGLYSYVLFAEPPTSATRDRYLMVIKSFQELVPNINLLKQTIPPERLNITYFPVTTALPVEPETGSITPEWLLDHYNYARATGLLAKLAGDHVYEVYLVSVLKPLSEVDVAVKPYAEQDVSSVPPELVRIWVREFFVQTSQETFWQPRTGEMLVLKLRTAIAVAAQGLPEVEGALRSLGFPDVKDAMTKWITWVK